MNWTSFLQVALGGAAGSMLRYAATLGVARLVPGFPLGTLLINIAGSFVMGALAMSIAAHLRPMLLTGLLGGFTTFSAFSLETLTLWEEGRALSAAGYVAGSVILSLLAVLAGATLARSMMQ